MTESNNPIAASLEITRQNIRKLEVRYQRSPGSVQLLAVSKTKPLAAILAAIDADQLAFGENYLDEAEQKIDDLDASKPDIEWHFIGAIQSRKCPAIATRFHWAHGVDRLKVAQKLSARRPEHLPPLNICLQVNFDGEASKAGVDPETLPALADACAELPGIRLRGLMSIPAPRITLSDQRATFARVREHFEMLQATHVNLDTLSMGMSGDLEAAIAEGATIVRIGTAIFGART